MADLDALKTDVEEVLREIPAEVVRLLASVAQKVLDDHRVKLQELMPYIMARLKPHAMALMMESATGVLDTKEVEEALMVALSNVVNGVPAHASAG